MANDYHLPTLLGFSDVQALAVCDVDSTRRKHAKKRVEDAYSGSDRAAKSCAEYNDFRDLLARESNLPKWRELQIAFRRLERSFADVI